MNENVQGTQGTAKSQDSNCEVVEGKTGETEISRTRLCRHGSDCQVRNLKIFAYKAKGFKQDIDIKLVFQED